MTEKLARILGYQQGWDMATVARTRQEIPEDVGRLTLRPQNIDEVLTCGGLWQGRDAIFDFQKFIYEETAVEGFQ